MGMGILQNLMRHLRGFVAWLRGIIGMYFLRIRRNFFFHLAVPIDRSIFFFINALAYGFPARKIFVVGILQADGTALISQHLRHILQESGRMVGSYLVDGSKIGDTVLRQDSRQTTNVRLFEFLRLSRRKRSDVVLIEVTLDDLRRQVYLYINFDAIIFTQFVDEDASPVRTGASRPADGNIASPSAMSILTADGSWRRSNGVNKAEKSVTRDVQSAVDVFLEYVAFQRRKFGVAKQLILNFDDSRLRELGANTQFNFNIVGYAAEGQPVAQGTLVAPSKIEIKRQGASIIVDGMNIVTHLIGTAGVAAVLVSVAVMQILHIRLKDVLSHFESFENTTGTLEHLAFGQPFEIIVDRAKTAVELERVYQVAGAMQAEDEAALLLCVLGARGEESVAERQAEAQIAARYCDRLFLTVDDTAVSGGADPKPILESFVEGLPREVRQKHSIVFFWQFEGRMQAIQNAIDYAKPQDIVVITGKVNDLAPIAGKPWDERASIRQAVIYSQKTPRGRWPFNKVRSPASAKGASPKDLGGATSNGVNQAL